MNPILISSGPVIVHTANVLYVIGWCIFSFIFWRLLRNQGILEERIFDLTFYATIAGIVFARLGFILLYPSLFTASVLLIGAFWVQPGLWGYSGLFGAFLTLLLMSKRLRIRFAHVFDAFVFSLPWALIPVFLGVFFQSVEVGGGRRHPVQLYELLGAVLIGVISIIVERRSVKKKWPEGLFGAVMLMILSPVFFALELFKDGQVYLYGISVNQWLLIIIFAESCGSVIVKGNLRQKLRSIRGGIYERFIKRSTQGSRAEAQTGEDVVTKEN